MYKSDSFSLGLVLLQCALLQNIQGSNSSEKVKNEKLQELKNQNKYGKWLYEIVENLLHYDEKQRWDFLQL